MTKRHWTASGFWLLLGLCAGMVISDVLDQKPLYAVATDSSEDFKLATGNSNEGNFEILWLLDYGGARLMCMMATAAGQMQPIGAPVQLDEVFKLERGTPKFIMVTGRYVGAQTADLVYIAETKSGQLVAIRAPGRDNRGRVIAQPQIVARFNFK